MLNLEFFKARMEHFLLFRVVYPFPIRSLVQLRKLLIDSVMFLPATFVSPDFLLLGRVVEAVVGLDKSVSYSGMHGRLVFHGRCEIGGRIPDLSLNGRADFDRTVPYNITSVLIIIICCSWIVSFQCHCSAGYHSRRFKTVTESFKWHELDNLKLSRTETNKGSTEGPLYPS